MAASDEMLYDFKKNCIDLKDFDHLKVWHVETKLHFRFHLSYEEFLEILSSLLSVASFFFPLVSFFFLLCLISFIMEKFTFQLSLSCFLQLLRNLLFSYCFFKVYFLLHF